MLFPKSINLLKALINYFNLPHNIFDIGVNDITSFTCFWISQPICIGIGSEFSSPCSIVFKLISFSTFVFLYWLLCFTNPIFFLCSGWLHYIFKPFLLSVIILSLIMKSPWIIISNGTCCSIIYSCTWPKIIIIVKFHYVIFETIFTLNLLWINCYTSTFNQCLLALNKLKVHIFILFLKFFSTLLKHFVFHSGKFIVISLWCSKNLIIKFNLLLILQLHFIIILFNYPSNFFPIIIWHHKVKVLIYHLDRWIFAIHHF